MSGADAILQVAGLTAAYGPVLAVRDATLKVCPGQVVALLGANGAGKTSLLRTVCGVVRAKTGHVSFAGRSITNAKTAEIAALGLAHVPEGREIFPQLTVRENLRMGAYLRSDGAEVMKDISALEDRFPVLRERASDRAGLLSSGQQQMIALARALLMRPKMLLMDEPSLGLAPSIVREVFGMIVRLKEDQLSILLVEQNVSLALAVSDYVYVMQTGMIVASGRPSSFDTSDLARFYLGSRGESDHVPFTERPM